MADLPERIRGLRRSYVLPSDEDIVYNRAIEAAAKVAEEAEAAPADPDAGTVEAQQQPILRVACAGREFRVLWCGALGALKEHLVAFEHGRDGFSRDPKRWAVWGDPRYTGVGEALDPDKTAAENGLHDGDFVAINPAPGEGA